MSAEGKVPQNQKFRVEIAATLEDFTGLYRLRYDIYCYELCSLNLENYPDREEQDEYDEYAVHIVAKAGEEVIGTMRLIKDNPRGFLMEQKFDLPEFLDRSKTVEHSRAAVRKEYRRQGVFLKILEKAYEWQIQNGYTICIGAAVISTLAPILLKLGYKTLASDDTSYHNVAVRPVLYYLTN